MYRTPSENTHTYTHKAWEGGSTTASDYKPSRGFFHSKRSVGVSSEQIQCKAWLCAAEYNTPGDSTHTHAHPPRAKPPNGVGECGRVWRKTRGERKGAQTWKERGERKVNKEGPTRLRKTMGRIRGGGVFQRYLPSYDMDGEYCIFFLQYTNVGIYFFLI